MPPDDQQPPLTPPTYERRLRRWRFALILMVLAAAVVAAAAAGWRFARTSAAPSNGPIVLISVDSLRADHLPLYGYRAVRTPAIDALAAEGVVFDRAYAHSPQTLPSHASILSGQLPFETGVRADAGFALRPDTVLLPQLLKKRGYRSGAVVSSYLLRKETGFGQAFDFYDSQMPAASAEFPDGRFERSGEESIAVAQKWIASLSTPRFFLFLHLDEPHAPAQPPDRFAPYGPYDGEVAYADDLVGRFLKSLKKRGLYDRATIAIVSDHGEGLGDHGEQEHGLFLYEETMRVPLVVKLPRDVNHGRRVTAPVQHIDLVPTILDLLDMPAVPSLRGRSLRALLEGRPATLAPQPIYAESFYPRYQFGWSEIRSLADDRYRYIASDREELYDLTQDPGERANIAAGERKAAQSFRAAIDRMSPAGAAPLPAPPTIEESERLLAIGSPGFGAVPAVMAPLPTPPDAAAINERCRQAAALAAQHRYADAIPLYRDVIAQHPDLVPVGLQLATVLERAGRLSESVEVLKRLEKAGPAQPAVAVAVAEGLLRMGKLDDAKAYAAAATKTAAGPAHQVLARVAVAKNDAAEARRQADLAQQADAAVPMPAIVQALLLYRAGKYEEAVPAFDQALQAPPGSAIAMRDVHYCYADTLTRMDRFPEAEAQLKEEIRLFPGSLSARVSLATLYRAQRRPEDAQQQVVDLLREAPTAEGFAAAARLWTILGDKDRAAAVRAEARQRFGRDALVGRPQNARH